MKYGSDLIAEIIAALGIPFVALNPGASFRGLHDSLVNHPSVQMPEIIECTHEEISVAVAHGYAKATGRIMAVAIHNTVGLQHATMAIFNAWCDRAPVFLMGGSGPVNVENRRPWIDWIHTANVQGNQIRDYVKYDDQPASVQSLTDSMYRAYRLSVTEPAGPVYVCFDVDLQEDPIPQEKLDGDPGLVTPPDPALFKPGTAPGPDPEMLAMIADSTRNASFPVIITDLTGRSDEAFHLLAEMTDQWGIAVVDCGGRMNISTRHPMNVTDARSEVLERADVVVALDLRDLLGTISRNGRRSRTPESLLKEDALLYSVGLQDYGIRSWSTDYQRLCPTTASVLADSHIFLRELKRRLADSGGPTGEAVHHRRREIAAWHEKLRQQALEKAEKESDASPIALSSLALEIWKVIQDKDFILANGNLRGWARRIFDMNRPFQYLGTSGGGGLGYGIGATIGAALAARETDRLVIDIQSDGDLMFTPGGLWTLAHHKLPALIIMNNNRTYFNSEEHQTEVAKFRGRDTKRAHIGTVMTNPDIDFAAMAKSMGVHGIGPIEDLQDVGPALLEAISMIEQQRVPVLVDIVTRK